MTRRPCAVVICRAYAALDSEFCPAHASLHPQGGLNLFTGRLDTGRRPRTRRRRAANPQARLHSSRARRIEPHNHRRCERVAQREIAP